MIRINLLPQEERRAGISGKKTLIRFFAGLAICMALLYAYGEYRIYDLKRQIQEVQVRSELLQPTRAKMADWNQKLQAISVRENLLIQLTGQRKSWPAIIAHLGMVMPREVWLTEFRSSDTDAFQIKGCALGYAELSGFLKRLEQHEVFTDPTLIKAEFDPSLRIIRFEVSVKLKGI